MVVICINGISFHRVPNIKISKRIMIKGTNKSKTTRTGHGHIYYDTYTMTESVLNKDS